MSERVTMPALGESVTEGTVTRWLKSVGDTVEVDEPLLEVSTDKVDTEIPSPVAGTLQEILVGEDDTVPVGADLAVIGDGCGAGWRRLRRASSPAAEAPAAASEAPTSPTATPPPQAADDRGRSPPSRRAQPERRAAGAAGRRAGRHGPAASAVGGGTTVTMPALGESVTEGTVTRWLKAEGDQVDVDEPLLEVSTDKVDTEIPSPVAGTLTKILVQRGRDRAGRRRPRRSSAAPAAPRPSAPPQQAAAPPSPRPAAAGAPSPSPRRRPPSPPGRRPGSAQQEAAAHAAGRRAAGRRRQPRAGAAAAGAGSPAPRRRAAARRCRRRARRRGLRHAAGAQARRRARRRPRLGHRHRCRRPHPQAGRARRGRGRARPPSRRPRPPPRRRPPAAAAPAAAPAAVSPKRGTTEKMTRLRKVIAARMVESLQVSAQLTTVVEVDVTKIARLRDRAKGDFEPREGVKLCFLPFFALAAVEALKAHPTVNASIDGDEITYHGAENLGIAVDTERGLLVPVIKDAGDLNIAGLARKIADLAERTRNNKITPGRARRRHLHADQHRQPRRAVRHPDHQPAAGRDPRHRRGRQAPGRRQRRRRRRDDRDPLDGLPRAVLRPPHRRRCRRRALPHHDEGASRGGRLRGRPRSLTRHDLESDLMSQRVAVTGRPA